MEPDMFSSPEIYLQADIAYHRDQIQARFSDSKIRRGTPIRRRHVPRSLRRGRPVATASS
jgi:hypothetical protein